MIVYETVYGNLMDQVCMLFRSRQIHFQLVAALIIEIPRCVHTFTCDGLSQYNTDYFNSSVCFFYEIIDFGFGVYFLTSG
jgi:hypothetical protein